LQERCQRDVAEIKETWATVFIEILGIYLLRKRRRIWHQHDEESTSSRNKHMIFWSIYGLISFCTCLLEQMLATKSLKDSEDAEEWKSWARLLKGYVLEYWNYILDEKGIWHWNDVLLTSSS
jgi:hypothetical protein